MDAIVCDAQALLGDACHIVADSEAGPRGISPLTPSQRNEYANLVLLCRNCHKRVDDQVAEFTVAVLQRIKREHEEWVKNKLAQYDEIKQRDDEAYATCVDEWSSRMMLDNWQGWASWLLNGGQPKLDSNVDATLLATGQWLFGRIWPGRYPDLEDAFHNFRSVLGDLVTLFGEHSEGRGEMLFTRKFYHIDQWDKVRYDRLYEEYSYHVGLVEDLALEPRTTFATRCGSDSRRVFV
jgi:hypothetical protein